MDAGQTLLVLHSDFVCYRLDLLMLIYLCLGRWAADFHLFFIMKTSGGLQVNRGQIELIHTLFSSAAGDVLKIIFLRAGRSSFCGHGTKQKGGAKI